MHVACPSYLVLLDLNIMKYVVKSVNYKALPYVNFSTLVLIPLSQVQLLSLSLSLSLKHLIYVLPLE
jgi:hypothetical protein